MSRDKELTPMFDPLDEAQERAKLADKRVDEYSRLVSKIRLHVNGSKSLICRRIQHELEEFDKL